MSLDTIVVAVISLLGTLAGSYFANSKTIALLSYRLEQLEREVEKHNSVVERTFQLENNVQTAFSRIDEIREALHEHQGRKESRDGGGGRNPLRLSRLFFCESHQFIRGKRLLEQTAHRRSWSKLSHRRAATQKRNWLPRSRVDCPGCI